MKKREFKVGDEVFFKGEKMSELKSGEFYSIDEYGNVSVTLKNDTTLTLGQINNFIKALQDDNERLKKQNEKYREALEFYASGDSWGHLNQDSIEYYIVDISDSGTGEFDLNSITDDNRVGGRRAREALGVKCSD